MKKTILIADDEPDMLRVVEFRLRKKGYEVVVAVNGEDAFGKAKALKPDLAILDYRMPLLNGCEVCDKIKADHVLRHIPVILLTASADIAQKETGRFGGFDAYLVKPFEPEEFLAMVEKYAKS